VRNPLGKQPISVSASPQAGALTDLPQQGLGIFTSDLRLATQASMSAASQQALRDHDQQRAEAQHLPPPGSPPVGAKPPPVGPHPGGSR
jgi:hypothetical protein